MKPHVLMTLGLMATATLSGCVSRGVKFDLLDAYPGAADAMPLGGDLPAAEASDGCRNDWVRIERMRHRHSNVFDRARDELFADITNTGSETIYVTISAEVAGPQHRWWTQAGGAFIPPGVEKRVSTCDEHTRDHRFTGVARISARAERGDCTAWRYLRVVR